MIASLRFILRKWWLGKNVKWALKGQKNIVPHPPAPWCFTHHTSYKLKDGCPGCTVPVDPGIAPDPMEPELAVLERMRRSKLP